MTETGGLVHNHADVTRVRKSGSCYQTGQLRTSIRSSPTTTGHQHGEQCHSDSILHAHNLLRLSKLRNHLIEQVRAEDRLPRLR